LTVLLGTSPVLLSSGQETTSGEQIRDNLV
jgi:hypothetical protein